MIIEKINEIYDNDIKETKKRNKIEVYKEISAVNTDSVNVFRHTQKAMIEEIKIASHSNIEDYHIFTMFDILVNDKAIMKKEESHKNSIYKNTLAFFLYSELSDFYMDSYFTFLKKNNIQFIQEVLTIESEVLETLISENFYKLLTMLLINKDEKSKTETIKYINSRKNDCIKLFEFLNELANMDIEIEEQDVINVAVKETLKSLPGFALPLNSPEFDSKNITKYNYGKYSTIVKSLLDEYELFTDTEIENDICDVYKECVLALYKNKDKFNIVNTIKYQLYQDPINLASIEQILEQIETEINTFEEVVTLTDYITSKMIKRNLGEIDYMPKYKVSLSNLYGIDNHSYVNGIELIFIDKLYKKFVKIINLSDLANYKLSKITKEEVDVLIKLFDLKNMRIVKEQMIKIAQLIFNDYFNYGCSEVEIIFDYQSNLDYYKIDTLEKNEQMFLNLLYTNNHSKKDSIDLNLRNRSGHGVMYDNSYTELLISYVGLIKSLKMVI